MVTMARVVRPWTHGQCDALNRFQRDGRFHPFTCGSGRGTDARHLDGEGVLLATPNGWVCPYCDYRQDWAHSFMLESAPAAAPGLRERVLRAAVAWQEARHGLRHQMLPDEAELNDAAHELAVASHVSGGDYAELVAKVSAMRMARMIGAHVSDAMVRRAAEEAVDEYRRAFRA